MDYINENYKNIRLICKTNMSKVSQGECIRTGGKWIIKQLARTGGQQTDIQLMAEPRILTGLQHPSLPVIRDIHMDDEHVYIVRQYIHGETLQAHLTKEPFVESDALKYFIILCDVFDYLHKNKIIYKDCKPSNIILDDSKRFIYLIDFGIAKDSQDSEIYGFTREFAAPEQFILNAATDERTDVYGLGATIYTLLTLSPPNTFTEYEHNTVPGITLPGGRFLSAHQERVRAKNPHISYGLDKIVMKCIHHKPEERYQSMTEIIKDLKNVEAITAAIKRRKTFKYSIFFFSLLFLFASVFMIFAGWTSWQSEIYASIITEGQEAAEAGDLQAAKDIFSTYIDRWPKRPEGYLELARLYISQNKYKDCVNLLLEGETALKSADIGAEYNYYLGFAFFSSKNYSDALEYFEKAIQSDPEEFEYRYYLAQCLVELRQYTDALEAAKHIPDNTYYEHIVGLSFERQKNWDAALAQYKKCLSVADNELNLKAFYAAMSIFENNPELPNSIDRKLEFLTEAVEKQVCTVEAICRIADIYYKQGMYDKCDTYLKIALTQYPGDPDLLYYRALNEYQALLENEHTENFNTFAEYAWDMLEAAPDESENTKELKELLHKLKYPDSRYK